MISQYTNFGKLDNSGLEGTKKSKHTRSVEVLKRNTNKKSKNKLGLVHKLEKVRHSTIKLKPVQPKMKKKINKKAVIGILQSMVSLYLILV